ncbi:unnamed protein product [Schistocephalus solidus]|uniref:UPF0506 domain-containing protein n=1 Tax=Schistocephalus solidus TaxID=70667 RepID=A0A3P7CQH5_SCHSO|nr:unnamed protein product [Schistocephalus solidus]
MSSFGNGKCVRCLNSDKACWRNRDCCSGKCSWFKYDDNCQKEGEVCSKTIFQRCYGKLLCELSSFGNGRCVRCLSAGQACWRNRECCSGKCSWLICK